MSRCAVDAITRSTLSSDDIAAATIASSRNALAPAEKTPGVVSSCGTTMSVSARPPGMMLRAYSPTGISSEYTTTKAMVDTHTPLRIAARLSSA